MTSSSRRLPYPEGAIRFPSMSSNFTAAAIGVDVGRRMSTCYLCHRPIPSGIKRLGVTTFKPGGSKGRGGGRIPHQRRFMHPECFVRDVLDLERELPAYGGCFDCGGEVERSRTSKRNVIGYCWTRSGGQAYLCLDCRDSSRWSMCDECCIYHPRARVSWTIANKFMVLCDGCAVDLGAVTAKVAAETRSLDRKADQRFEDYRSRLVEENRAQG